MALSHDGSLLFVVNTANNCLEIFSTQDKGLTLVSSVVVGVDPVAVALRNDKEAWVVNHISDSVSIVFFDCISLSFSSSTQIVLAKNIDILTVPP